MEYGAKVKDCNELFDYSNHLKSASAELQECYHDMKVHAADVVQQWQDDSAERFMQFLEERERVIADLSGEFLRFEQAVRRRAEFVQEYKSVGQQY